MSLFIFLGSTVTPDIVLTNVDLELVASRVREHAMFSFLDMDYLTEYDIF